MNKTPKIKFKVGQNGRDSHVYLEHEGKEYDLPVIGMRIDVDAQNLTTVYFKSFIAGGEVIFNFEWDKKSKKYIGTILNNLDEEKETV